MSDREQCKQVAGWLKEAESAVAFTGAGISTESGIPDFRSPGGVWSKYQPVMYQDFVARAEARREYWRQKCEARPFPGSVRLSCPPRRPSPSFGCRRDRASR